MYSGRYTLSGIGNQPTGERRLESCAVAIVEDCKLAGSAACVLDALGGTTSVLQATRFRLEMGVSVNLIRGVQMVGERERGRQGLGTKGVLCVDGRQN